MHETGTLFQEKPYLTAIRGTLPVILLKVKWISFEPDLCISYSHCHHSKQKENTWLFHAC